MWSVSDYQAFSGNSGLTAVTVPESVKSIGEYAFSSCGSLEKVTLSEGLESILPRAFAWCNDLKSINLPNSVREIADNAFEDNESLTCIVQEDSYAEDWRFWNDLKYTVAN